MPRTRARTWMYGVLSIVGYAVPDFIMVRETVRTGNVLFWTDPARTNAELFANATSTAFALDLFGAVVVALIWFTLEARDIGLRRVWVYWVLTLLLGLAGTLPLFLLARERHLATRTTGRRA
jgi:hypothetical protein